MKKWIIYTTGGILGSAAVAGVAVSTVYYTKYKNLYDGLKTHGLSVEVYNYDSPTSTTASGHTIYKVADNEKTLEDLLLNNPKTKSNPSNNPQASIKDALNVGVASVVLDHSQIIKFYKTPA